MSAEEIIEFAEKIHQYGQAVNRDEADYPADVQVAIEILQGELETW